MAKSDNIIDMRMIPAVFARMKAPAARRVTSSSESDGDMDSFIVPDDEVSFEDPALYIKADRKLRYFIAY